MNGDEKPTEAGPLNSVVIKGNTYTFDPGPDLPVLIGSGRPVPRPPFIVVRIKTTLFRTARGFAKRRDMSIMKSLSDFGSERHDFLSYDADMIGADELILHFTNFDAVPDGLYSVSIVNEKSDWETPNIIDDYDYQLEPYENEKSKTP